MFFGFGAIKINNLFRFRVREYKTVTKLVHKAYCSPVNDTYYYSLDYNVSYIVVTESWEIKPSMFANKSKVITFFLSHCFYSFTNK